MLWVVAPAYRCSSPDKLSDASRDDRRDKAFALYSAVHVFGVVPVLRWYEQHASIIVSNWWRADIKIRARVDDEKHS
jgi:hypothetical protein